MIKSNWPCFTVNGHPITLAQQKAGMRVMVGTFLRQAVTSALVWVGKGKQKGRQRHRWNDRWPLTLCYWLFSRLFSRDRPGENDIKLSATMIAALGAATLIGAPAVAQMQSGSGSNSMGTSGSMQSGSMGSSSMALKMSKMQMKQMQKCQAMSSDMMAKNKTCAKMMKMHPEMMNSSGM